MNRSAVEPSAPMARPRSRRSAVIAGLLLAGATAGAAMIVSAGDDDPTVSVDTRESAVAAPGPIVEPSGPAATEAPGPGIVETTTSTATPKTTTSTDRPAPATATTATARPAVAPVPRPPAPAAPTVSGLYVVNADTGGLRRVATGAVHDPVWSPDGTRLLFHRDGHLLVVGADGSNEAVIAGDVTQRAVWSPDGSRVAFISGGNLFVARPDGTDRHQIAGNGVTAVAWSPDGAHLALVGVIPMQNRIEVVRPDGSDRRLLVTTVGTDGKVSWSPDSTRLAYLDYNVGPAVLELATAKTTPLTTQRNMGWVMSWSPAGDEVAFADYLGTTNNLSIGRTDGSGVRTVASGAVAPAWSPNGGRLAFLGNRSPDSRGQLLTHLYVVAPSGQGERILISDTRSTHIDAPAWAPNSVDIAFAFAA